jgi:hypothetical protein
MRNIAVYPIALLLFCLSCTPAHSGLFGNLINGVTGNDDYPGGPKDIQRANEQINNRMQEIQQETDEKNRKKAALLEEKLNRIEVM